jgi:hypothetical protein
MVILKALPEHGPAARAAIHGKDSADKASAEEVAELTLRCLKSAVPSALPGIVRSCRAASPTWMRRATSI